MKSTFLYLWLDSHKKSKFLLRMAGQSHESHEVSLKVVGNEKLGGLRFLQLLGIGLGPWR